MESGSPSWEFTVHSARFRVGLLFCIGYFSIGKVCTVYPFSSFSMYASSLASHRGGETRASHVLAKVNGRVGDVSEFGEWACDPWQAAMRDSLVGTVGSGHLNVEETVRAWLVEHTGPALGGEPVELVRRIWTFSTDNQTTVADILIAHCRAVRR